MDADGEMGHDGCLLSGVNTALGMYMLRNFPNWVIRSRTSITKPCLAFAVFLLVGAFPALASAPQAQPVRRIPFVLVTDRFFRELPNWRGLAQGALAMASEDLE